MFTDPQRLAEIAAEAGGLQILYAGKAHPQDSPGKSLIQQVVDEAARFSNETLRIVYLEDYAWIWRAAHRRRGCVGEYAQAPLRGLRNQRHEGGSQWRPQPVDSGRMVDRGLYRGRHRMGHRRWRQRRRRGPVSLQKLGNRRGPLYLAAPEKWARLMRTTIAFNGSFFNTNRMVKQYTRNSYYPVSLVERVKVEEEEYVT